MKKIVLSLLVCLAFSLSYGQTIADSISIKKGFGGYKFYQHDIMLSFSQLGNVLEPNAEAYEIFNKAQTNNKIATILGGTGGFLIGYPIGYAIGGGDPKWIMTVVGAGIVSVAIPISLKSNRQAKSAVDIYNSSLVNANYFSPEIYLKLGKTDNGFGVKIIF